MAQYTVHIGADLSEYGTVDVEAESPEEASRKAWGQRYDVPLNPEWNPRNHRIVGIGTQSPHKSWDWDPLESEHDAKTEGREMVPPPSITVTIKPSGDIEIDGAGPDVRIVDERKR